MSIDHGSLGDPHRRSHFGGTSYASNLVEGADVDVDRINVPGRQTTAAANSAAARSDHQLYLSHQHQRVRQALLNKLRQRLLLRQHHPQARNTTSSGAGHDLPCSIASNCAELAENEDWVRVTVDLPGVRSRDLDVVVDIRSGLVSIAGTRRVFNVDRTACTRQHKFARRYAVDTRTVNLRRASTVLASGVLTFWAPKKKNNSSNFGSSSLPPLPQQDQRILRVPVAEDDDDEVVLNTSHNSQKGRLHITFTSSSPSDTAARDMPSSSAGSKPTTIPNDADSYSSAPRNNHGKGFGVAASATSNATTNSISSNSASAVSDQAVIQPSPRSPVTRKAAGTTGGGDLRVLPRHSGRKRVRFDHNLTQQEAQQSTAGTTVRRNSRNSSGKNDGNSCDYNGKQRKRRNEKGR